MLTLTVNPFAGAVQAQSSVRSDRLGIAFISSLDLPANEHRYQRALLMGAAWNRWPLYWDRVEVSAGVFDWSAYDRLVSDDLAHGLQLDTILLGRPGFYGEGGSIAGLNAPVFSDGSDTPGGGKTPNPSNFWARFVYDAVTRYRPGGLLATQQGWPAGRGIRVWEAWNEPDLTMFWRGSVADYARLLKVAYLAAHQADPEARVMFGGLAYGNPDSDDWLDKTLALFATDPQHAGYGWFMDMVGVHNYSDPRRSGLVVRRVLDVLRRYGLERPVWLNETGAPVWDDYPGPTWTGGDPAGRRLRVTMAQAAAFVAQSAAYAWAAGAEVVFFHQLYDDCGNQSGGTDFPPNNGELCAAGGSCAGDAFGFYRNERGAGCFTQHPLPDTPRPSAAAFYRLAQVFGAAPFGNGDVSREGDVVTITFMRPLSNERVVLMWNRSLTDTRLELVAQGHSALLVSFANEDYELTPTDGKYSIGLAPATPDDFPYLRPGEVSAIGGLPMVLIERIDPTLVNGGTAVPTAAPILLTPGAITATQPPRPTTEPEHDATPPTARVTPLPIISPTTFTVYWSGEDDSGIEHYLIWVRVDEGEWKPWLETNATQGQYTGEVGRRYAFAAWAQDLGGNWSLDTDLQPQAETTVQ